ncbi:ATP-binding protein [Streptomyces sp. NPDC006662]|uniref:ATP-binding protein n=1 Tax=Streptomyces sp. NPDC006662 TaxID=3156902 RepID=UPI0033C87C93
MTSTSVQPTTIAGNFAEGPPRAAEPARQLPREADAILLCFRTSPPADHDDPSAEDLLRVAEARRTVLRRMTDCGLGRSLADDVALVVSELLTNAILHGEQSNEVVFMLALRDGLLIIIVTDGAPACRSAHAAPDDAEHGRGLTIVNAIAQEHHGRWGATSDKTGTWCELPVTETRGAA